MRVYVDTNVLIPAMEGTSEDAALATRLIDLGASGKLRLVTSEVTLSEVLVVPIRRNDELLVGAYVDLLAQQQIFELVAVTRDILVQSSHVRARSSAKLPDSIHVATAVQSGCDAIVSYDRRLGGLSALDVIEPSDARFATLDEGGP